MMLSKCARCPSRRALLQHRLSVLSSRPLSGVSETLKIPSRAAILTGLQSGEEYDVLIIGGGATGAGAALDARLRGLKVACVEREDFACKNS